MKLFYLLAGGIILYSSKAEPAANVQYVAVDNTDRACPIPNQIQPIQNFFAQTYTTFASGSYCVVANLTASTTLTSMIVINNSQVTLDLGGFLIDGQSRVQYGIFVNPGVRNVTIRNGTIANTTNSGIFVSSTARNVVIENVTCVNNFNGFSLGSSSSTTTLSLSTVANCTAAFNRNVGFAAQLCNGVLFNNCVASNNSTQGFLLNNCRNCEVTSCTATFNALEGFLSNAGTGGVFDTCYSFANGVGFSSSTESLHFENCTAEGNVDNGTTSVATGFLINADSNSLQNCIAKENATGFSIAGVSNLVLNSIIQQNSLFGVLLGVTSQACEIRECSAFQNGVGFQDDAVLTTNRFYTNFANNNTANFVNVPNVTVSPVPATAINFTSNIEA